MFQLLKGYTAHAFGADQAAFNIEAVSTEIRSLPTQTLHKKNLFQSLCVLVPQYCHLMETLASSAGKMGIARTHLYIQ